MWAECEISAPVLLGRDLRWTVTCWFGRSWRLHQRLDVEEPLVFVALRQTHDVAKDGSAFADVADGAELKRTVKHAQDVVALSIVLS